MSLNIKRGLNLPFRRHLQDDDNTFLPPPLSAYALALLGTSGDESPIDKKIEGNENDSLRESLKSKLAVHFKESPPSFTHQNQNGTQNSTAFDSSAHNSSSHNISSQNTSAFNTSGPTVSHHTSTGQSNHSFTSSNAHSDNDELHNSHNEQIQTPHQNNTGPSPPVSSVGLAPKRPQLSAFTSHRRSRFARRFAQLGPPKRASEIPDGDSEDKAHSAPSILASDTLRVSPPSLSLELAPRRRGHSRTPPSKRTPPTGPISKKHIPRGTISGDSSFFKSLEKLRKSSLDNDLFSPIPQSSTSLHLPPTLHSQIGKATHELAVKNDSPRPASDFKVFVDNGELHYPSNKQLPHFKSSRPPLKSLSPNKLIPDEDKDGFRKPKIPRLSAPDPERPMKPLHPASVAVPEPLPAVVQRSETTSTRPPSQGSEHSAPNDGKKRKLIFVNDSQYEKLELLGRGGSSKVYKARSVTTKRVYAIKKVMFDQFDDACVNGFKGEIDLLNKLRDEPRVVRLFEHSICDGSIYLTMECGDIDMAHVLQTRIAAGYPLDVNFVRFHAMEILKCVEAVHRAGIVHSDLKPANFLFVRGMLKIIDFGIANAVPDHTANVYRESQIGTPNYMAPEALTEVNNTMTLNRGKNGNTWRIGKPSDIWSCGCIIYQMIYGRPPYASYAGQLRIMAIMNPQVKVKYATHGLGDVAVPLSVIELMQRCLARSPFERWTVEQCLNSDFLKPKAVSKPFIKDIVRSAVNYGYSQRYLEEISNDTYDKLVSSIIEQIESLNYT